MSAPGSRRAALARRRPAAMRLLGFLVLPFFNVVTPLLTLPAITSRYGAAAWAAIAVAQSLGSACSVVVELGWFLSGSQRVARQSPANRRRTYVLALLTRSVVAVPMLVVAGTATFLIVQDHQWIAALVAVAVTLGTLNTLWYFVGAGTPSRIILTDSLPRIVPVIVAAVLILAGVGLWVYPVALLLPALACPLLGMVVVGVRRADFRGWTARRIVLAIRAQSSALASVALSAAYIALPVTLVGVVAPGGVAVFAAAERLQRMVLSVLAAVPNALQGWVGRAPDAALRRTRARRAVIVNACVGIVAGAAFTVAAPFLSDFVFSGVAPVSSELAAICALMIVIVSTSRATGGIMLVALRRVHVIAVSALTGGIVGVPAILLLGALLGPPGGLLGEVAAELAVLTVQLLGIRGAARRRPRTEAIAVAGP